MLNSKKCMIMCVMISGITLGVLYAVDDVLVFEPDLDFFGYETAITSLLCPDASHIYFISRAKVSGEWGFVSEMSKKREKRLDLHV